VLVFTVKLALVWPLGTVMLAGTVATEVLLLDSNTVTPPLGAGPFKFTVASEGLPPTTDERIIETDPSRGLMEKLAELEVPPPGAGL
jgi:hypothetical protein